MPNSGILRWVSCRVRTNPALGRMVLRCIPDCKISIHLSPIGPFFIRLRRNRSYWLRHPLAQDGFSFGALRRLIRPGETVYDVGSNIGLYTRFMIETFGAGQVIAFEPDADNRAMFAENITIGGISARVRQLPFALSDRDGEEEFHVDDISSQSGVLNS